MRKIMFRGREVVEVPETDNCVGCIGVSAGSDTCLKLPSGCSEFKSIFVFCPVKKLAVFIEQPTATAAYFACSIGKANIASGIYSSRRAAIRGAKRFFQKIGFECRIKGDK